MEKRAIHLIYDDAGEGEKARTVWCYHWADLKDRTRDLDEVTCKNCLRILASDKRRAQDLLKEKDLYGPAKSWGKDRLRIIKEIERRKKSMTRTTRIDIPEGKTCWGKVPLGNQVRPFPKNNFEPMHCPRCSFYVFCEDYVRRNYPKLLREPEPEGEGDNQGFS